ncbi:MAG: GNAT family N-acetyltransferase [Verrucomicrobiae bacterium]|nr:GNAT family N-acetyltransferase [Verrucomicrobiae bacterium]
MNDDSEPSPRKRPPRRRPRAPLPAVEIREMRLEDVPQVFALGQELFTAEKLPTLYRSWDDHELAQLFSSEAEFCLVAESEDRIVGFALGRVMEKPQNAWKYGWLLWLGVSPRFKGRGLARRLLNQLTERFIAREARIMLVDTDEENHEALAFFRKNGFGQEIRHVYLSRNLDDYPRKNGGGG